MHFGGSEVWVILLIVLLIFGAPRIPQFMRGLGQGIKEFKDAVQDDKDEPKPSSKDELPSRPLDPDGATTSRRSDDEHRSA